MALDLATAQAHLAEWIAADSATASGTSYTLNGRTLTRNDAETIRDQITWWQRQVNSFTSAANGGSSMASIATWS